MWIFEDDCLNITKNTEETIRKKGYPLIKYIVTTEDGYMNTMYRIPHGKNDNNNNIRRTPVLFSHGLLSSCALFVNQCSLAYYLADRGFDIWLSNNRGTTFSRKHKTFDTEKDKEKYWDFSWHEIGIFDIPAFIDFILDETGFEKLFFIGHSQGVTAYVVFGSERPEYNKKILLSFLLGPPVIFENNNSLIVQAGAHLFIPLIEILYKTLNIAMAELPLTRHLRLILSFMNSCSWFKLLSQFLIFLIAGSPNYEQTQEVDFSQLFVSAPNSASVRQLLHYGQVIRWKTFTKYDHGPERNLKLYGKMEPCAYDLSKITSPIVLFYATNDMYTHPKDIEILKQLLGNVIVKHKIVSKYFNHVDFLIARDTIDLLYCHIVRLMKMYDEKDIIKKPKI